MLTIMIKGSYGKFKSVYACASHTLFLVIECAWTSVDMYVNDIPQFNWLH